jgi:hypothetical protein
VTSSPRSHPTDGEPDGQELGGGELNDGTGGRLASSTFALDQGEAPASPIPMKVAVSYLGMCNICGILTHRHPFLLAGLADFSKSIALS